MLSAVLYPILGPASRDGSQASLLRGALLLDGEVNDPVHRWWMMRRSVGVLWSSGRYRPRGGVEEALAADEGEATFHGAVSARTEASHP